MGRESDKGAQMSDPAFGLLAGQKRSHWIRLRTMILLRWVAIAGQLAAIVAALRLFDLRLELGPCLAAVGASVIVNLLAMFIYPANKRLSEAENFAMMFFDMAQLGVLLYLTGGLNNPFAMLVLGPVTVSASVLTLRSVLGLAAAALVMVTVLGEHHMPLRAANGTVLQMPELFIFGNWIAIVSAIFFLSAYARRVAGEMHAMSDALAATQMALSREQKLTDLGGVVAAAAHELGTPLATIKLASAELMEELRGHPELGELAEDAALIRDQADRCRDILRSMGRAGKDDLHMRQVPLSELVREAAEPHQDRGKIIRMEYDPPEGEPAPPEVLRRPEIVHGLRNLIQNAVDFAEATVWIEMIWTPRQITLRILDDGPGFPAHLLGRLGDPFMKRRRSERGPRRPGYEGMGLGLFIAKTLLERSGAELSFANGRDPFLTGEESADRGGAVVEVTWPRPRIDSRRGEASAPLGENQPFLP